MINSPNFFSHPEVFYKDNVLISICKSEAAVLIYVVYMNVELDP